MAVPYLVWSNADLDASVWQGIQFLSFEADVNRADADDSFFAAVVSIHLARPANGITAENVVVEGGESIQNLDYKVIVPSAPPDENPPPAEIIEVRFRNRGDYSPYTIRLLSGGADPLHPFFERANFNFYIDCPSGDCRRPRFEAKPILNSPPAIDLKTKDYSGFMQVLGDWIKVSNPLWSDLSPASFERMLLELLCHHADFLSYYQDRVANEAFIQTARNRHSLRQHGLLLGYELDEGQAATTTLAFDVTTAGVIPEGVEVNLRGLPGETSLAYVVQTARRLDPAWNSGNLIPAAWSGAVDAILPQSSTGMLLWGHDLNLHLGQILALIQEDFVELLTLTEIEEITSFGWVENPTLAAAGDANLTRVAWTPKTTQTIRPWSGSFMIRGNLVPAVHGAPRIAVLAITPPANPKAVPISLNRRNSVVAPQVIGMGEPIYLLRSLQVPEGPVVFEAEVETGTLVPALQVRVDGELWSRQTQLWNSRSYDRHFVAETDNQGRLWLQFGDGVRGREIRINRQSPVDFTPTVEIEIQYRVGVPTAGNCARETLNWVPPPAGTTANAVVIANLGITQVTNITPGQGGRLPESLESSRLAIPASLRQHPLKRAVTLVDYARVAMTVPGVARATALNLGGPFNTVAVLVDPQGQAELTESLKQQVSEKLDYLRMAGREHRVLPPTYVPLNVQLIICAEAATLDHRIRERVLAALRPGTLERLGFFHPDRISFGDNLELGDLIAFVQSIPGVRAAKALMFRRLQDPGTEPRVLDLIELAPTEVARLDGNENRPENGTLRVFVVGLDDLNKIRSDLKIAPDEDLFQVSDPVAETAGGIS